MRASRLRVNWSTPSIRQGALLAEKHWTREVPSLPRSADICVRRIYLSFSTPSRSSARVHASGRCR